MKKMRLCAMAGVVLVSAAGGTFAYYNSVQTFSNPFDTTNYSTYAIEKFNPGDGHEWKPGAKVTKEVYATNTGDGDVWVRVKFDEAWKKNGSKFVSWDSGDDAFNPASADRAGEKVQPGTDNGKYVGDKDGVTQNDTGSVVYKEFENVVTESPAEENKKWYLADDGYYYYTSTLIKNQNTAPLLKSVQLCGDADMGKFHEVNAYIVVDKGSEMPKYDKSTWTKGTLNYDFSLKPGDEGYDPQYKDKDIFTYKASELDDSLQGYANANYELNITIEFIQADEEGKALDGAAVPWSWYPGKTAAAEEEPTT